MADVDLQILNELRAKLDELQRAIEAPPNRGSPSLPELSFLSPCYNEAENIESLCSRIAAVCKSEGIERYEIVLVENGSVDDSEAIMRRLHAADPRVKMVQLSRNFGYQGAISCGLEHVRGEWVVVLDGDLQDPPELVPKMLQRAREGHEVVYGVREKREEGAFKRLSYYLFYRIWRLTSDIGVPLDAGDFCVMHRRVVETINRMPERQRFVRGLRSWSGFRQTGIPYEREGRTGGRSKFNLRGMVALAMDGLLSYSTLPLRLMAVLGAAIMTLSFSLSILQAGVRLLAYWDVQNLPAVLPPGLSQLNLLLTFLIGFNTLCVGVVGEYVGRVYNEVKRRPLYVVSQRLD